MGDMLPAPSARRRKFARVRSPLPGSRVDSASPGRRTNNVDAPPSTSIQVIFKSWANAGAASVSAATAAAEIKRFIGVLLWYVPAFCPGTSVSTWFDATARPTLHDPDKRGILVWIGHALLVRDARLTNNRPTSNIAARLYGDCSITPNARSPDIAGRPLGVTRMKASRQAN